MGEDKKIIIKPFRINQQEAEHLKIAACEKGMTESSYLRLLLSQKPNDYPDIRNLIKELINEVNHIGTNVNQIVKNNNSGLYLKDDKERLFAYMRKLNLVVREAVDYLGNQ